VDSGGAGGQGGGVGDLIVCLQVGFEAVDVGAQGGDPVGVEGLVDEVEFFGA
jgi:hypothetical protein